MPSSTALYAVHQVIKVGGSELRPIVSEIESVTVVDRLARPDTFSIGFRDIDGTILTKAGLDIGKEVNIAVAFGKDAPEELIDGEVTTIESTCEEAEGALTIVRGYDRSHRLASGRKTRTFEGMTYSDIVKKVAGDGGLTPEVDSTQGVHEHVLQANVSDLEFLYSLARVTGFECRVEGKKLLFKKPTESSSAPSEGDYVTEDPTKLVFGRNLLSFDGRMSAVGQVTEVNVHGWDPANKEEIVGTAIPKATNAELAETPPVWPRRSRAGRSSSWTGPWPLPRTPTRSPRRRASRSPAARSRRRPSRSARRR